MNSRKKIVSRAGFVFWRKHCSAKIVFTNGCFDIIHPGHVDCLEQCRGMGDALVVGLNSDASVRRIKGAGRPVNPVQDRSRVLAGLACVDFVLVFEENTPYELIRAVRPDILVKGGDWPVDSIVGRDIVEDLGGKVVNIELTAGHSTTDIITRIRNG